MLPSQGFAEPRFDTGMTTASHASASQRKDANSPEFSHDVLPVCEADTTAFSTATYPLLHSTVHVSPVAPEQGLPTSRLEKGTTRFRHCSAAQLAAPKVPPAWQYVALLREVVATPSAAATWPAVHSYSHAVPVPPEHRFDESRSLVSI